MIKILGYQADVFFWLAGLTLITLTRTSDRFVSVLFSLARPSLLLVISGLREHSGRAEGGVSDITPRGEEGQPLRMTETRTRRITDVSRSWRT